MRRTMVLAVLLVTIPVAASAKGAGVGLWMEGKVSDVKPDGESIRLVLTGRFSFEQYRGRQRSVVEVTAEDGPATIPATITQAEPFFAMGTDWRGGAIREPGALLRIVRAAERRNRSVRFQFFDARLSFGRDGSLIVLNGAVIRATDDELR